MAGLYVPTPNARVAKSWLRNHRRYSALFPNALSDSRADPKQTLER